MQTINEAAAEFLSDRRVVVPGVSHDVKTHGSSLVYPRLRQRGYQVFAVNPHADADADADADAVEADPCCHDLASIQVPGRV